MLVSGVGDEQIAQSDQIVGINERHLACGHLSAEKRVSVAGMSTAREGPDLVFDEAKLQQSSLVGSLLVETRVEHGVGFRNVYNTARASQTNTYGSS